MDNSVDNLPKIKSDKDCPNRKNSDFLGFFRSLKSEKFRFSLSEKSLFLCYYCLIFKSFNILIKQQQLFFNCQNRKNSEKTKDDHLFSVKSIKNFYLKINLLKLNFSVKTIKNLYLKINFLKLNFLKESPEGIVQKNSAALRFPLRKKQMPAEARQTVFCSVRCACMPFILAFRSQTISKKFLINTQKFKKPSAKNSVLYFLFFAAPLAPLAFLNNKVLELKSCAKTCYRKLLKTKSFDNRFLSASFTAASCGSLKYAPDRRETTAKRSLWECHNFIPLLGQGAKKAVASLPLVPFLTLPRFACCQNFTKLIAKGI